jgi:hypothetical protein
MPILIDWKSARPFSEAEQKLLSRLADLLDYFNLDSSEMTRGQDVEVVYAYIFQNPLQVDFQMRVFHKEMFIPVSALPLALVDDFFEKESFEKLRLEVSKNFRERIREFYPR